MTQPLRQTEAGFSLIEAMIALAILAITAVSFLRSTEANITRVGALEARFAATWAAQNWLTDRALGLHPAAGPVQMLGRDVTVVVKETPTSDPTLLQVDVTASVSQGAATVQLSGLVLASGAGGP